MRRSPFHRRAARRAALPAMRSMAQVLALSDVTNLLKKAGARCANQT
jgi:hypothetical protein